MPPLSVLTITSIARSIPDHYEAWKRGYYEGAVKTGAIIHVFSDSGGHGLGVNPLMAALPSSI